ncbi:MAG: hypothetical protein ABIH38_00370 [Patescibacteria group bacterium]
MQNKAFSKIGILIIFIIFIGGGYFGWQYLEAPEESISSKEEALTIAQVSSDCSMAGILTNEINYNAVTKTWWIDLERMPELEKDGCNPACVVNEETKTAEVNWRCTGLLLEKENEIINLEVNESECKDFDVRSLEEDYYKGINALEQEFEGILEKNEPLPPGVSTTVMRKLPYSLNGMDIDTKEDLSEYVGKQVIMVGKNTKFELEDTQRNELKPKSIMCSK